MNLARQQKAIAQTEHEIAAIREANVAELDETIRDLNALLIAKLEIKLKRQRTNAALTLHRARVLGKDPRQIDLEPEHHTAPVKQTRGRKD